MNVENILKVADAIEGHTIRKLGFHMGDWVTSGYDDLSGQQCGTTACIAGWTSLLMSRRKAAPRSPSVFLFTRDVMSEASAWLDLDYHSADDLFYAVNSPVDRHKITSSQAVAVLRNLAETGEVDWGLALSPTEGERG